MEKVTNYKIKDFLKIKNEELISQYSAILELLQPIKEIDNPDYNWFKRSPKKIMVKEVKSLSFGEVSILRNNLNEPILENIFESVKIVTGLDEKLIWDFTIIDFYSILCGIKEDLITLSHMEANELSNDDVDVHMEMVNASQRMSRFGVANPINSLAGDDITKWGEIEKLPYMTVITKLIMDKEKAAIQNEVRELQQKQQQK